MTKKHKRKILCVFPKEVKKLNANKIIIPLNKERNR